jgi:hypothetical protein
MRQTRKTRIYFIDVRYIAASGMALTLCLLSLLLFRGALSLLQALLIPLIIVLLTKGQPWKYMIAVGLSLFILTLIFFPTQAVFMVIYLLMTLILLGLLSLMKSGSRLRYLLIIPYWILNSLLLFFGLKMTDYIFQTKLHTMMIQLSGDNMLVYAAIMMLEAAFISILHFLLAQYAIRLQLIISKRKLEQRKQL